MYTPLEKEDYIEPRCVLCGPDSGGMQHVPLQRIMEKFDEYCGRNDFPSAERHLKYWYDEADQIRDVNGMFSLSNELMGFYRKQGQSDNAFRWKDEALELMNKTGNTDSVSGATCYINSGTVCSNFGKAEEALQYFEKAQAVLENIPHKDLYVIGSLYNNMAAALQELNRYEKAEQYYYKALETMKTVKNGELEQAVTYMNLADLKAMEKGIEPAMTDIGNYLEKAFGLIQTETLPRDGYYAFVCEKCAPGFYCYGYPEQADKLAADAEFIRKHC